MRSIRRAGVLKGTQKRTSCFGYRKAEIEHAVRISDERTYRRRIALAVWTDGKHILCRSLSNKLVRLILEPFHHLADGIQHYIGGIFVQVVAALRCQDEHAIS